MLLTYPPHTTATVWLAGTEHSGNALLLTESYGRAVVELTDYWPHATSPRHGTHMTVAVWGGNKRAALGQLPPDGAEKVLTVLKYAACPQPLIDWLMEFGPAELAGPLARVVGGEHVAVPREAKS